MAASTTTPQIGGVMTDTNLTLQIMNATSETTFTVKDWSGISQPPSPIGPGQTTYPPCSAGSDFQVNGHITLSDGRGGGVTINFYMPVLGSNEFSIVSNPEGRYNGTWIGSLSGWNVTTVAQITDGTGEELTSKPDAD